jgi:hypothetical protein
MFMRNELDIKFSPHFLDNPLSSFIWKWSTLFMQEMLDLESEILII